MKILIVKLGAAGDILRTTALLPGLKEKYLKTEIDWLTQTEMADLLISNYYLKNIVFAENIKDLLNKRYDLVINLDADLYVSRVISKMHKKKLVGTYDNGNSLTYTADSASWFDMSLISKFGKKKADLLKRKNRKTYQEIWYNILGLTYRAQRPYFPLKPSDTNFASTFADKKDYVIGINTSAGYKWEDKKLSIEDSRKLIKKVRSKYPKAKIILLGGPNELRRNREIADKLTYVINATCNGFGQLGAFINLCNSIVTSDSLGLHIATALNKKVIAFFGPTSPWEINLYDRGTKILPIKGCLACYRSQCRIRPKFDLDSMVKEL